MKVLAELLDDLAGWMQRAADQADVESVHQLRVSVRRASEGLKLFGDEIPHAKRLRREILKIRARAGAVRDRDITRERLRRHRLPDTDPACIYLDGQRDLAALQLREFLQKQIRRKRAERWAEMV
jgi:CHAD domain-containing protein